MKDIREVKDSKWGKYVEFEGQMAFLSYAGNWEEFETGGFYKGTIFYEMWYAKNPDRAAKEWMKLTANSREEMRSYREFKERGLSVEDIYPYFNSRPEWKVNEPASLLEKVK